MKKRFVITLFAVVLCLTGVLSDGAQTEAAKKMKLSRTKLSLKKGKSKTLKVKNVKKGQKIVWKSSKKKVATVSKKGKVKAKRAGRTVITAKIKKKTLRCRVTVTDKKGDASGKKPERTPAPGSGDATPTPTPNLTPMTAQQKAKASLIEHIMLYGKVNSNGGKVITESYAEGTGGEMDTTYGIAYQSEKDCLQFVMLTEYQGSQLTLQMMIPTSDIASVTPQCAFLYESSAFVAVGTVDLATYTKGTVTDFEIQALTEDLSAESAVELADKSLQLAMLRWDSMLAERTGLTMRDIGFLSY